MDSRLASRGQSPSLSLHHFQVSQLNHERRDTEGAYQQRTQLARRLHPPAMTNQLSYAQVCARAVGIEVCVQYDYLNKVKLTNRTDDR